MQFVTGWFTLIVWKVGVHRAQASIFAEPAVNNHYKILAPKSCSRQLKRLIPNLFNVQFVFYFCTNFHQTSGALQRRAVPIT